MTKHTYLDTNLVGVALLGEYRDGNIRDALRRFRDPFLATLEGPSRSLYCDDVMLGGVAVTLTVSYEGSHTEPGRILASAFGPPTVDEKSLKGCLDELLEITGIKELKSAREQFEEEPFRKWAEVSRRMWTV